MHYFCCLALVTLLAVQVCAEGVKPVEQRLMRAQLKQQRLKLPSCKSKQQKLTIRTSQQAARLAAALQCHGGTFFVTWQGAISISETIAVESNTTVHITGSTSNAVVDGQQQVQLFTVAENAALHLQDITLARGYVTTYDTMPLASLGGAAVYIEQGFLTTQNVNFSDNFSNGSVGCGAVMSNDATVALRSTQFLHNSAAVRGGAMCIYDGSVMIKESAFTLNQAINKSGGAIFQYGANPKADITSTEFSSNAAAVSGGALCIINGSVVITNSVFSSNQATDIEDAAGGAIFQFAGNTAAEGTRFSSNIAGEGGALYLRAYCSMSINSSNFTSNSAVEGSGGAIVQVNTTLKLQDSIFSRNSANITAAALHTFGSSTTSIERCLFEQHDMISTSAQKGQARQYDTPPFNMIDQTDGTLMIMNTNFSENGNLDAVEGAIVFHSGGTNSSSTIMSCSFVQNDGLLRLDDLCLEASTAVVRDTVFDGDFTYSNSNGTVDMSNCKFVDSVNGGLMFESFNSSIDKLRTAAHTVLHVLKQTGMQGQ
jgi:Chlamydia polymorphic membrane protein (Chlamydia_PMP) repeat